MITSKTKDSLQSLKTATLDIRCLQEQVTKRAKDAINGFLDAHNIKFINCDVLFKKMGYSPIFLVYEYLDLSEFIITGIVHDEEYTAFNLRTGQGLETDVIISELDDITVLRVLDLLENIEKDLSNDYLIILKGCVEPNWDQKQEEDNFNYADVADTAAGETIVEMMLRYGDTFERINIRGLMVDYRSLETIDGLHRYDIRHSDDDMTRPCTVESNVVVNHYGHLFTRTNLHLEGRRDLEIIHWKTIEA